ncbi:MAG: tetratricopeptide repeat protein [Planctomycetes bacterium]|nr:tetratricopeptide repeat protein [Planctomycetota bacterium]
MPNQPLTFLGFCFTSRTSFRYTKDAVYCTICWRDYYMRYRNRIIRINFKLFVILIVVTSVLIVSMITVRRFHRSNLFERSLEEGQIAFENNDWSAAAKSFREYLIQNPDDIKILKKYAEAMMSTRPLDASVITGSISIYRRIIQLDPSYGIAYEKLVRLFTITGNFEELDFIARMRLKSYPNDRKAQLWLADALIGLNKTEEAQQTLQTLIGELDALAEQYVEYVQACVKMSSLSSREDSLGQETIVDSQDSSQSETIADSEDSFKKKAPLEWLDRAVEYAPDSADALVCRARFYRQQAEIPGTSEEDKLALLGLARKDLGAADAVGTDNPQIRYFLGVEWLAHGELDQAATELHAVDKFPQETLKEHFFDFSDWTVARFLLTSEIALRKGATIEAVSLADETLSLLTEKRHRVRVLPSVIPLFIAAGKVLEARCCLDEYLEIIHAQERSEESPRRLALLQALVARAEEKPYTVIDALQQIVANDSSLHDPYLQRLIVEAYNSTDQAGRAVSVLLQYLQQYPEDPEMTVHLAKQYSKLGDWKKVFETARKAESLGSSDIVLKLLRIGAGINLAVGQADRVETEKLKNLADELADLRREHPDRVDIRILQTLVTPYLEQPGKIEAELKLAIEECEKPLRAEMQLARHYLGVKRMNEAVNVYEIAYKRHPEVAEPWLALSDLHVANADYDAARSCLKQGLNTLTEKHQKRSLSIKLALLELIHGDRTIGTDLLKELTARDEQEIQARLLLLGVREIQNNPVAVERLVSELRHAEGESGLWWRLHQASLWLSLDNWHSKQHDIANLLQYCIDADPMWSMPVLILTGMYERLGDYRRVENMCRKALSRNPSATDIANRLLALFERQARFSDAEKVLQQIEANPRFASSWQVQMTLGAGEIPQAIEELKLRVSNDDQDASSRIQLARLVYQETKNANEALAYLTEAEAIGSGSRALIALRASILRTEGRKAEALRVIDDYVSVHNNFGAYWMRAVYLAEEGEHKLAEQDYRKLTTFAQNGAAGHELLGNFFSGTGRLDQGVAAIEEGLSIYPENLRLKRILMRLLFRRAQVQDRDRALTILAEMEVKLPQDVELMTVRAIQMLQESKPNSLNSAREKLQSAIKLDPTAINTYLALIGLEMQAGEYRAACNYAISACASNPNNPALLIARGRAEHALGNHWEAVQSAEEVLEEDPNSIDALNLFVNGATGSGINSFLVKARTLIESQLGHDPTNERLLLSRARVLIALKLPKIAIPELEVYCQTKAGSSSIAPILTLADLYHLAGNSEQAGHWIEQAERLDSSNQAVIHARFLWLVSQNRFEELAQISSAYLSGKEQDPTKVIKAATILAQSDSETLRQEGLKLFEHAVTISPTSIDARLGLATSLSQAGYVERAKGIYQKLLDEYPTNVYALNELAWILQKHDHQYEAALELANRGLRIAPDDPYLLDTRGVILSNMVDRLADAKKDFEKLVRLSTSDSRQHAKALLQLGRTCVKLKDLVQAKQHLKSAIQIDQKIDVFTTDERSEIRKIIQASEM